jgi:hypothetical protein
MIYKCIAQVLTCFLSGLFVDTLAAVFVLQKPNNNVNISQLQSKLLVYYLNTSRSALSDIKREAQPSVLCLIKHDNECFE